MKNKKNFTILAIGVLNFILSAIVINTLSKMVPINIFGASVIDKMQTRNMLYILPGVVLVMCASQVLYRLKTMDKAVTTGKRIEDAVFTILTGTLMLINWSLIYIGYNFTATNLLQASVPVIYLITAIIGIVLATMYSSYPINKFQSIIGLRTKETLEDEGVWRIANRFNAFTGFVSSLVIIGLSIYFTIVGFDWVLLLIGVLVCGFAMFYLPRLYAKMVYSKKADIIIE